MWIIPLLVLSFAALVATRREAYSTPIRHFANDSIHMYLRPEGRYALLQSDNNLGTKIVSANDSTPSRPVSASEIVVKPWLKNRRKQPAKRVEVPLGTAQQCAERLQMIRAIVIADKSDAVRASGFICDAWMTAFVKELSTTVLDTDALVDSGIRVKLWSWTIRPNLDINKTAPNANMCYHDQQKQEDECIGMDTHFFTMVDLWCLNAEGGGRYWLFDTVSPDPDWRNGNMSPSGRDVTDVTSEGRSFSKELIQKDFTFEVTFNESSADAAPEECGFADVVPACVIEYDTPWIAGKSVTGWSLKNMIQNQKKPTPQIRYSATIMQSIVATM